MYFATREMPSVGPTIPASGDLVRISPACDSSRFAIPSRVPNSSFDSKVRGMLSRRGFTIHAIIAGTLRVRAMDSFWR